MTQSQVLLIQNIKFYNHTVHGHSYLPTGAVYVNAAELEYCYQSYHIWLCSLATDKVLVEKLEEIEKLTKEGELSFCQQYIPHMVMFYTQQKNIY